MCIGGFSLLVAILATSSSSLFRVPRLVSRISQATLWPRQSAIPRRPDPQALGAAHNADVPPTAATQPITGDMYDAHVSSGRVVVYFTAPWCGPCKNISPTVKKLARETEGLLVYVYDITTGGKDKAKALGIRSLPWFILYKDGEKIQELSTINPEVLVSTVAARLLT